MPFKTMSFESFKWFLVANNAHFFGFTIYTHMKLNVTSLKSYKMLVIDFYYHTFSIEFVPEWEGSQIQVMHYTSSSMYTLNKAALIGEP
jgi:hypothetical protein